VRAAEPDRFANCLISQAQTLQDTYLLLFVVEKNMSSS
jgi:hypothetical protein